MEDEDMGHEMKEASKPQVKGSSKDDIQEDTAIEKGSSGETNNEPAKNELFKAPLDDFQPVVNNLNRVDANDDDCTPNARYS